MLKHRKIHGFTLLELMVTVAIMAIMAAIALPSMSKFVANTRVINRAEQIANLFRFAKGESIRMNTPVIICGVNVRSDGRPTGACNATAMTNGSGMMAFADKNKNGTYEANTDVALRTISINGNLSKQTVSFKIDACPLNQNNCNVTPGNEFIFMPNGMFGFRTPGSAVSSYSALSTSSTLGSNYVRFLISDSARANAPSRFVIVTPSGSATSCNPVATASRTTQSKDKSTGDMAEVCSRAVKS